MEEREYDWQGALPQPQDPEPPTQVPAVPTPWWRRRPLQLLAAAAVVGIGAGVWFATRPADMVHVHGTLAIAAGGFLPLNLGCQGDGGYSDITTGVAVTVGGANGQTLGIGALGVGHEDSAAECVFPFDVQVPAGQSLYTVTISHRGTQTLTPDELVTGIQLTLGD